MYILITKDYAKNTDEVHLFEHLSEIMSKYVLNSMERGWSQCYEIKRELPCNDPEIISARAEYDRHYQTKEIAEKCAKISRLQKEINQLIKEVEGSIV